MWSISGLYEQIQQKYNMSDPHCLFDLNYLKQNPTPFFDFAKVITKFLSLSFFPFFFSLYCLLEKINFVDFFLLFELN